MSLYPIRPWEPFKDRHSELVPGSEQAHDQYWINEFINILVLKEWYMNQKKLPARGARWRDVSACEWRRPESWADKADLDKMPLMSHLHISCLRC